MILGRLLELTSWTHFHIFIPVDNNAQGHPNLHLFTSLNLRRQIGIPLDRENGDKNHTHSYGHVAGRKEGLGRD
jgi:hypothetical protein